MKNWVVKEVAEYPLHHTLHVDNHHNTLLVVEEEHPKDDKREGDNLVVYHMQEKDTRQL